MVSYILEFSVAPAAGFTTAGATVSYILEFSVAPTAGFTTAGATVFYKMDSVKLEQQPEEIS